MARDYLLSLDLTTAKSLGLRIAEAIVSDITRGRLQPGDKLPGSRRLALRLGVNRNTVNAALADLVAQGWLETAPARGVFVRARDAREPLPRRRGKAHRPGLAVHPGFSLPPLLTGSVGRARGDKELVLTGGVPDPRLFPYVPLTRAYRRVLARRGPGLLDYGDARGEARLREGLARMLAETRGLAARADDVLITRGSQQAIWLAAQALLRPGDRVGVETYGYPPALQALRSTGAVLVPLNVDAEGVRLDELERALTAGGLVAAHLTPHHQYPTMASLSAPRRLALLALAQRHRFALIEDDYSHEFHFTGRPRLPLASQDEHGVVIYVGSLSKVLAPGLRIGYAVAPAPVLERMAALRTSIDRQGDNVAEAAVAELLEDGELARHARRMRQVYQARRDVLMTALRDTLGERVSFEVPQGGMALWVQVHGGDPVAWAEKARERGVTFGAGRDYHVFRKPVPFVRMGFTRLDERELRRAVRLAETAWVEA